MIGIFEIEVFVLISIVVAWIASDYKFTNKKDGLFLAIMVGICLIFFNLSKDISIFPDMANYISNFNYPLLARTSIERSFFHIRAISILFTDSLYGPLFIYSLISIVLRISAIYKYSYNIPFSLCVWISNLYILHEMIQIRAAVASAFLLWLLPLIKEKKKGLCLLVIALSTYFHYSSLIFILLLFLNPEKINIKKWIIIYLILFIINILKISTGDIFAFIMGFIPSSIGERIEWINYSVLDLERPTMYSRYILIPTLITFGCLLKADKLQEIYPYSIVCIKCSLIGIFIYSFSIPVVSGRLFELLSTSLIYLCPLCLCWFRFKGGRFIGKLIISIACIAFTWNLIYKQEIFENL